MISIENSSLKTRADTQFPDPFQRSFDQILTESERHRSNFFRNLPSVVTHWFLLLRRRCFFGGGIAQKRPIRSAQACSSSTSSKNRRPSNFCLMSTTECALGSYVYGICRALFRVVRELSDLKEKQRCCSLVVIIRKNTRKSRAPPICSP